jgi:hypothetical protein
MKPLPGKNKCSRNNFFSLVYLTHKLFLSVRKDIVFERFYLPDIQTICI